MANMMDELETLELAAHLLGIDENADDFEERVDDKLYETWGIDYDSFRSLCSSLLPLCEVGQSPITKQIFRGFAVREEKYGRWLARVDA